MKTSFYFVLWIILYPLLGLLHSPWIDNNAFLVALFVVWGISWFLNRSMPEILRYEGITRMVEIMDEIYTGKTELFRKRILRQTIIAFITALYFGVTFAFILATMVKESADDWIALLVFGFFGFGAISQAYSLNKAVAELKSDPSEEKCAEVAETIYKMDYSSFKSARMSHSFSELVPPAPPYFKTFQITSIVFSVICGLLGFAGLLIAVINLFQSHSAAGVSSGIMYFLYGSLALYFGLKDTISGIGYFRRKKNASLNIG